MPAVFTPSQVTILRVLCTIFPVLVASTTLLRLYIKGYRRLWWDDLLVALGMLVMAEQQIVLWSLSIFQPPSLPVFYTVVTSSACQVWFARGSIMASIYRIAPTDLSRKITLYSGGLILIFFLVSIAQQFWVCQAHLQYGPTGDPMCVVTFQVPMYQFITAIISDALLIGLPLHTLRLLKRHHKLRRRLQAIFAASAIITLASITDSIMNFLKLSFPLFVAAQLECWISLIVCNFAVLHSAIFHYDADDMEMKLGTIKVTPTNGLSDSTNLSFVQLPTISFLTTKSGISSSCDSDQFQKCSTGASVEMVDNN